MNRVGKALLGISGPLRCSAKTLPPSIQWMLLAAAAPLLRGTGSGTSTPCEVSLYGTVASSPPGRKGGVVGRQRCC